jgi:hypothetical protein
MELEFWLSTSLDVFLSPPGLMQSAPIGTDLLKREIAANRRVLDRSARNRKDLPGLSETSVESFSFIG